VKITDFGLAKYIVEDPNQPQIGPRRKLQTACGTPGYVAPEVLKQKGYDEYVDLWSTGVILYIMLCGFPPFSASDNPKNLYRKIKKGDYSFPSPAWDQISDIAKDCVRSLLTVDPKARMSANELLEHPWIKQAELQSPRNIMSKHFQRDLRNYLHRKRLRRGVELIVTLNRMIRAAGLEEIARKQRQEYRKRLAKMKIKLKEEQRQLKEDLKKKYGDDYEAKLDDTNIDVYPLDDTPPIDYAMI
jgi:calcium/calmodulin-dependent protein kinase I